LLDLSDNQLSTLPAEIGQLTNLAINTSVGAGLQELSIGSHIERKTRPYKPSATV
jgi:Leucine-rich repeat (LRR) protein